MIASVATLSYVGPLVTPCRSVARASRPALNGGENWLELMKRTLDGNGYVDGLVSLVGDSFRTGRSLTWPRCALILCQPHHHAHPIGR